MNAEANDAALARQLLPILVAAALGLVPFTVYSTFLIDIAESVRNEPASVGALRGLGGLAAIAMGAGYAAVTYRLAPVRAASASLILLAVASALGSIPEMPWLVVFCLGIGAATSILNPALQTAATEQCDSPSARGRAATMVTATTTATAVLAAPILGGLSWFAGWRGILWMTAGAAIVFAAVLWARGTHSPSPQSQSKKPRLSLALRDPGTRSALIISGLRTAAFMGALSVVAAVYAHHHGLRGAGFTPVWTLSGASFLLGNWFSGKFLASRHSFTAFTVVGIGIAITGIALVFASPMLIFMLCGTTLLAVGHSMIAAAVTTSIARSNADLRASAFALNGVVQSVGTFMGAALAGAGYALGDWIGVAVTLAGISALGLMWVPWQHSTGSHQGELSATV